MHVNGGPVLFSFCLPFIEPTNQPNPNNRDPDAHGKVHETNLMAVLRSGSSSLLHVGQWWWTLKCRTIQDLQTVQQNKTVTLYKTCRLYNKTVALYKTCRLHNKTKHYTRLSKVAACKTEWNSRRIKSHSDACDRTETSRRHKTNNFHDLTPKVQKYHFYY